VTVTNPDGGAAWLTNAFTVEQAIGVWTTGGPYGGDINDLAVSPLLSTTAFAAVRNAGLYATDDRGASWHALVPSIGGVGGFAYTAVPTSHLYYWSEDRGLWHWEGGLDWQQVDQMHYESLAVDPQDGLTLWAGTDNGAARSLDGGTTWAVRTDGLPAGVEIKVLAVHPADPNTVYAGTHDGLVYRTTDAGLNWQHLDQGLPPASNAHSARALAIDPFDPNVVLYSRWNELGAAHGYRSTNGGDNWDPILAPEECGLITDLAFSPYVSGTVYASLNANRHLGISTDGGATWQCVGQRVVDFMASLGLDPASGMPAYLGGHSAGTFRRAGDLASWERASEGIAGLPVNGVSASPVDPDTVYVAAEHGGAYRSDNAGSSWRQLSLGAVGAFGVAAHPSDRDRAFFGTDYGICYNPNGTDEWLFSAVPVSYQTLLNTLAPAPGAPSTMLVGGRDLEAVGENIGVVFRTDDGGASWVQLDFGHPISHPAEFAIHPTDSQTMYLATSGWERDVPGDEGIGLGIFCSGDGGDSWTSIKNELGDRPVSALAIRPDRPQILFAGGVDPVTWGGDVFRSTNGGNSWSPAGLPLDWAWVEDFAIDPTDPDTVYAGTGQGLFYSSDGGNSWNRSPDEFGYLPIQHVSIASDGERTVLYVVTLGGLPTVPPQGQPLGSAARAGEYVQAGVYQLTIDHRWRPTVYLPLVSRVK